MQALLRWLFTIAKYLLVAVLLVVSIDEFFTGDLKGRVEDYPAGIHSFEPTF